MRWNWQKADWRKFTWDSVFLSKAEEVFLLGAGVFVGTLKHLGDGDQEQLTIDAISSEALTTAEIEGEILDRSSVQSSIRRHFGLTADSRRIKPAEQGMGEMMVHLYRSCSTPLSEKTLFDWHRMLMNGRRDLKDVGKYRTHKEPMQVVSGPLGDPKIHFEAPPSSQVPEEMSHFIRWFNRTAPDGPEPLSALSRTGLAHLYFVSIHPFEDGNGRIGRAIAEKSLSQSLRQPTLTALSATILMKQKAYYQALEAANKKNEITDWLVWFAATTIEAQRRTMASIEFLMDKTRFLDRLKDKLNSRQQKVLLRVLREYPTGWKGGITAAKYALISKAKPATTTRDLADLVVKGALARMGERRHARYSLCIPTRTVAGVSLDKRGNVVSREGK